MASALALLTVLVAISFAAAQGVDGATRPLRGTTDPVRPRPAAKADRNPCAQFGAGFVRAAGSDTCVKVGGGISVGVGVGSGR